MRTVNFVSWDSLSKEKKRGGGKAVLFCLPCRLFFLLWFLLFSPQKEGRPPPPGPSPRCYTLQDKPWLPSSDAPTSPSPPLPPNISNISLPFPLHCNIPSTTCYFPSEKKIKERLVRTIPAHGQRQKKSFMKITAASSNLGTNVVRDIRGSCWRVRSNHHSCVSIRFQVICLVKETTALSNAAEGRGEALLCLRIISMHSAMGHGLKLFWSETEKYERQISATIHIKVLLNSFRCNGHTLGFHSKT